jgi:hypothetical protein
MELLLFHHGQTGYFHIRRGRAELCQSSSVVVLDGGSTYRYQGPDRRTVLCPKRTLLRVRPGRMRPGVSMVMWLTWGDIGCTGKEG